MACPIKLALPRMGNVSTQVVIGYFDLLIYDLGSSINDITHLGGGGSAKRRHYYISLFSKMGDKRERRVKNLKRIADVIFEWLL